MALQIGGGDEKFYVGAATYVYRMGQPSNDHGRENWTEPIVGTDSDGNLVTAQFGLGEKEGETRLGDGDRTTGEPYTDASGRIHTGRFEDLANHDHYGRGDGNNDNGTLRGNIPVTEVDG